MPYERRKIIRRVFFSFYYKGDIYRVSRVRNIGMVEGNQTVSGNKWESITRGGPQLIKKWIDSEMRGKSCVIVLVGAQTAGRKWINYEIEKAWNDGKGLVGIYVNKLVDQNGNTTVKGRNPFREFTVNGQPMNELVKCHTPSGTNSRAVYRDIAENLEQWVEEAIKESKNRWKK